VIGGIEGIMTSETSDQQHDELVVLHSVHKKPACKQITRFEDKKTGKVRIQNHSYAKEHDFRVEIIRLTGFAALAAALNRLIGLVYAFVIRGAPAPTCNRNYTPRRKKPRKGQPATFVAAARYWVLLDIDHITVPAWVDVVGAPEDAIEYVIGLLPAYLHDACFWWAFTASQGLPKADPDAPNTLSVRLAFWSEAALSDAELKRWAAAVNTEAGYKLIDPVLFDAIQAHYIAAPLFNNMVDPLPRRTGVRQGLDETISLVIPPADPKHPDAVGTGGYGVGPGTAYYLEQIGRPHFFEPIKSVVGSYIAIHGAKVGCDDLKADIRAAIQQAIDEGRTGGRDPDVLDRYASNAFLDPVIDAVRDFQGDKPGTGEIPEPPPELDDPPPLTEDPDMGLQPALMGRPILHVVAGELPSVVDQAEAILIKSDRDLYEYGDQIVRPALAPFRIADNRETIGLRLVPVRLHHTIERFTRAIDFRKYSRTRKAWEPTDCPEPIAKAYLERMGAWRLPKLAALTCCPMLLADGRIVDRPGFDRVSGILFDPQGVKFPPVPQQPSKQDAEKALLFVKELVVEFPFDSDASRSVFLSALLTSVSRLAFDFAPLHAFDAPLAGTGKSKLVDCIIIVLTGHECAVISQGDDETEFEKRLGAELIEGVQHISVNNCEAPLGGQLLCQILSQPYLKVRVLGLSKSVLIGNCMLIFATGNNLTFFGDMLRRALKARLDAGVERPELRTFARPDPVLVLKRNRGPYASALLTVLRAYIAAGRPCQADPLGGFEGWSRLPRSALIWLGEADPVTTIELARAEDPTRQRLEAVITQWRKVLDDESIATREVIAKACGFDLAPIPSNPNHIAYHHPDFRNALLDVAGERGRVSPGRLGNWLGANKYKVVGDSRIAPSTMRTGDARWKLQRRQSDGAWR
jgi:hypothetical protein